MLKMLLDPMGGIVLTNDGHAILREIEVAHPAAKSMIELSRTQDEEVGDGTTTVIILAGEMLAQALGNRFVHVPYRSGAQMLQAILTGEAQFGIAALASATPLVREGKVRGVAMVGSKRFPLHPEIPTLAELGLEGFDDGGFFVLIAPAGVPRPVAEALNRALVASLNDHDIRDKLLVAGHDPVRGPNSLADARAFMEREAAKFAEIVRRTGVRLQP
mgnify:CR=1 FL=1